MAKGTGNALSLALPLIQREIGSRYRGSMLGPAWSLVSPLFMLTIYTFAFGVVMKARWVVPGREVVDHPTAEFATILFAGLIIYQFFCEVVGAATVLIVANAAYVKKTVFPVYILPLVSLGTALFHAVVSTAVLLLFNAFMFDLSFHALLFAPLAFAVLIPLVLGLAWFLAAAGVYFRDLNQIVPPVMTALLFMSPVFFPLASMPAAMQELVFLNPLTVPVETFRNAVVFGLLPHWRALALYSIVALGVGCLGLAFFNLVRKGFADVL